MQQQPEAVPEPLDVAGIRVKGVDALPVTFSDARNFTFDDEAAGGGVLEISDDEGRTLVAYAPGRWEYAMLIVVAPATEEVPDAR